MSDIIERLRAYNPWTNPSGMVHSEAADEIEKLRGREKILIQELEEVKEERDAAVARYRHVIEILRRDGYWAALMEDDEIDAQVDAARGGA